MKAPVLLMTRRLAGMKLVNVLLPASAAFAEFVLAALTTHHSSALFMSFAEARICFQLGSLRYRLPNTPSAFGNSGW